MSSQGTLPSYDKPYEPRTRIAKRQSGNSTHDHEHIGTVTIIPALDKSRGSDHFGSASQLPAFEELELAPIGEKSLLPSPPSPTSLSQDQQKPIERDAPPVGFDHSSSGAVSYGWKPVAWILLRKTAPYVLSGVAFMIFAIGLVQVILLPHIYSCPVNSICSARFDPNRSNILNTLQTDMAYCLKIGTMISGYGLMKLNTYQAWILFSQAKFGSRGVRTDRKTIDALDLHIGAVKGGLLDAVRLLRRRKSFLTAVLVLGLYGIDAGSNFIVGQSITRSNGTRELLFEYPGVARLPASDMASLNNDGQLAALWMVRGWAMANDTRHGGAFHGSMVVPDSRINSSVNPVPGGAIMDGTLTCTGVEPASIVTSGNPIHNISISIGSWVYVAQPDMRLAVSQIKWDEVATTRYLWFSNTAGVLPNATKVNSTYYVTECQHTLSMTSVSPSATIQTINPAVAIVEGCNSMNTDDCVADSVSKTILSWWGGIGQSFWGLNCRGGVLGHLEAISEDGIMEAPCKLTESRPNLWKVETFVFFHFPLGRRSFSTVILAGCR
ncbi:hypothetical protein CPC08DRAFT_790091 [Agrocybe pediades]|nr:hypothetical protein CPC08DRAFT_790091 [Agrocybe pediades]